MHRFCEEARHDKSTAKMRKHRMDLTLRGKKREMNKSEIRYQCHIQGGSNMTGTDLCVNKPHCAAAVRP